MRSSRELRRALGREQAEDAYQETFLKALRAYGSLRHADNLRAWVLTIARRVAVDQLRRREASPPDPEPDNRHAPGLRRARRARGRPAAQGTSGRRAPLRLRPFLRRHRRCARLQRGCRAPGDLVRSSQTTKEDAMTVSPTLDNALPRGGRRGRLARRRLRPHRLADRDAARRDDRPGPVPDLLRSAARA